MFLPARVGDRTAPLGIDVGLVWAGPRGERVLLVQVDHRRWPSSVQSRRAGTEVVLARNILNSDDWAWQANVSYRIGR